MITNSDHYCEKLEFFDNPTSKIYNFWFTEISSMYHITNLLFYFINRRDGDGIYYDA